MATILVVTSGKGGVGKTTTAAAFGTGLALQGKKTAVVDFDVGLRNLDLIMGCERRVVYDLINVINGDAKLNQALIKDKRVDNLFMLPTSQTRDKEALKREGIERIMDELREQFDYIVCDSPAGIEHGAQTALYFADEAIVVTNPEVSSVRDSDRMIGILASKSRRAERSEEPVKSHVLITRYDVNRVERGDMLKVEDVVEMLALPLLGVIPESEAVLQASNVGAPVVLDEKAKAGQAYRDAVARYLGEQLEFRFVNGEKRASSASDRSVSSTVCGGGTREHFPTVPCGQGGEAFQILPRRAAANGGHRTRAPAGPLGARAQQRQRLAEFPAPAAGGHHASHQEVCRSRQRQGLDRGRTWARRVDARHQHRAARAAGASAADGIGLAPVCPREHTQPGC